jgi:hypothetical protein
MSELTIEIPDVEILSDSKAILRCRVGEVVVDLARTHVRAGSRIAHTGDRGTLVIPRWLGVLSGMTRPPYSRSYGYV